MKQQHSVLIGLALAAFAVLAASAPSMANGFGGRPDGVLPACTDAKVLASIQKRFDYASDRLYGGEIGIESLSRIHQHRIVRKPDNSVVLRKYCHATAMMNDGRKRTVWYLIEDGMGFAGYGDAVEFCVSGYERLRAYSGHCRVLR
ncbi:MAG: hypothetical protein HC779_01580 [Phyllobacteriaceae bacterium]|nr:hypothetical protein [Phyllobacteriaceae bacterium]